MNVAQRASKRQLEKKMHLRFLPSSPGYVFPDNVKKAMRTARRVVGSPGQPISGSLTVVSKTKVLEFMIADLEFTQHSKFFDFGSGNGDIVYFVSLVTGAAVGGIECCYVTFCISQYVLLEMYKSKVITNRVEIIEGDIDNTGCEFNLAFKNATHCFAFDKAFNPATMIAIAKLFNASPSAKYFIGFHKPRQMAAYGFNVDPIKCGLSISMTGSNTSHKIYSYTKNKGRSFPWVVNALNKENELSDHILCDQKIAENVVKKFLSSERPKRKRTAPVRYVPVM